MFRPAGAHTLLAAILAACGSSDDDLGAADRSIVGGRSTAEGAYAATGALLHGRNYRCTATLIAPDVVLTAAHCLEDTGFGDFGFTFDTDLSGGVPDDHVIPVVAVHQHPDFNPGGHSSALGRVNDIGVVILARPIADVSVEPLDKEQPTFVGVGTDLALAAYGLESWYNISTVGIKRDAMVRVATIGTYELVTVAEEPQPCRGDSGGPLFVSTPEGRLLAGVVSRGAAASFMCDQGAIATRIAPYLDFIAAASLDHNSSGCAVGGRGTWLSWLPLVLLLVRRRPSRRT